jgi:hypothetical protein
MADRNHPYRGGGGRGPYRSNYNSTYRGGGGGGRGGFRGRFGGGGGRRGGGGRGGGGSPHHHYRGGGHPHQQQQQQASTPANRFTAQPRENSEDGVWRNLLNMLTVVGEPAVSTAAVSSANETNPYQQPRNANLKSLVDVITGGTNATLFLAHDPTNSWSARDHYGPMVIHLLHCVTSLPQHTSVYATLTHMIHARSNSSTDAHSSFAKRVMGYAGRCFGRDLTTAVSTHLPATDRLLAERRCHLLVRFWAQWWMNMSNHNSNDLLWEDHSSRIVPLAIQKAPLESFPQLVQTFVTAAQLSRRHYKLFTSLALTGANTMIMMTTATTP